MTTREEDVGIHCYISGEDGLHAPAKLTAVMRHRFADFRVTEVDLEGREACITTLELPRPKYTPVEERSYKNAEDACSAYSELYPQNEADTAALRAFLDNLVDASRDKAKGFGQDGRSTPLKVTLAVCEDKAKRTRVHAIFRNCPFLPVALESKSPTDDQGHRIVVAVAGGGKRDGKDKNGKGGWKNKRNEPWSGGKEHRYIKFVMEKVNIDSNSALHSVSKMLRMNQKLLGTAGTKDKRAVTAQFVTLPRVEPKRLAEIGKGLSKMFVRLGNFQYATEPLMLGDLSGNRFEIVLRGVALHEGGVDSSKDPNTSGVSAEIAEANTKKAIREAVARTVENGFVNYFGLQRFGTGNVGTHVTGELLLRGEWKEALDSILKPTMRGREDVRLALETFFEDRNAAKALKALEKSNGMSIERTLLEHLSRSETAGDYPGALDALPKNMKALYISAFHSYVWNNVVSERIRTYGATKVLVGDLVVRRGDVKKETGLGKRKREQHEMDVQRERGQETNPSTARSVSRLGEPHVVTEEDIKEGRYTIDDVVMPVSGTSIRYPENDTADFYAKYDDRINAGTHNVRSFMAASYVGDYRYMVYRPKDMEVKFYRYKQDEDVPRFEDIQEDAARDEKGIDNEKDEAEKGDESDKADRGGLAMVLRFFLPSSTYATMCIREIMRMPTDVGYAKQQRV